MSSPHPGACFAFSSRLARAEKLPMMPGPADLHFDLYETSVSEQVLWSEIHGGVELNASGAFAVWLGSKSPLPEAVFDGSTRWLQVRAARGGRFLDGGGGRIALLGEGLRLEQRIHQLEQRLAELESTPPVLERGLPSGGRTREQLEELGQRVRELESSGPRQLNERMEALKRRMDLLDGEGGRVERLEDELEDLAGPDGDVVDLNERMDRIEGRAPELLSALRQQQQNAGDTLQRVGREQERLAAQVAELQRKLEALHLIVQEAQKPDLEAIGALRRAGDTMSGGLTIQRGGLEVLSGTLSARGAEMSSLEATTQVKTPKLMADAIELRGDLTVDHIRRVLQVRMVEGRQASTRKDGPLLLNSRGGGEVVIGNEEQRAGAQIHGRLFADALISAARAVARTWPLRGEAGLGEVVRLDSEGEKVQRCAEAADPRAVGVVTDQPCLLLGGPPSSTQVAVAVLGEVEGLVDCGAGEIRPGDLLGPSAIPGHLQRVDQPAALRVRALGALAEGSGRIRILLG